MMIQKVGLNGEEFLNPKHNMYKGYVPVLESVVHFFTGTD